MKLTDEQLADEINRLLGKSITPSTQLIAVLGHREMFYCFCFIKHKYNYFVNFLHDKTAKEIASKINEN